MYKEEKPILVTQPSLPPIDDYAKILSEVFDSGILTHHGPKVQLLESEFKKYFYINGDTTITVNGTFAIQLAIRALNKKQGMEIITTPFSFIATVSSIMWENFIPVFVDIDPKTFNIDANKIEEKITKNTAAILPVHVFSRPCELSQIQQISNKYNVPIIYDAAHAVGVNIYTDGVDAHSIMDYGHMSATSFHATKIFNSGEGGAVFTQNQLYSERLKQHRFFGFDKTKDIVSHGTNAKMTEIHAALGLENLKHIFNVMNRRKYLYGMYMSILQDSVTYQDFNGIEYNYSYMPVVFKSEEELLKVEKRLNEHNIFPRRYFYPSLNTLTKLGISGECKQSEDIAKRIACLPLYTTLSEESIENICKIIKEQLCC